MAKQIVLTSTGERVFFLPGRAKVPVTYDYRVPHGKRVSTLPKPVLTGKGTTPRQVVSKPVKPGYVRVIIEHADRPNELAIVKLSNLSKVEVE